MTTFSLSMVVNWDNCHKPSLRKIFITRKKVGLIEYFHSCYTKISFNAQKNCPLAILRFQFFCALKLVLV